MYKRLKELREDSDLTQQQVSEMLNMSRSGYRQHELGLNDIPTKILIELAKYYLANKSEDSDWVIFPVDSFANGKPQVRWN